MLGWVQSDPQVLTRRDPVMATPLHLLVLYHSPAHIEIALEIMQNDDHVDRISDQYGEGPCKTQNDPKPSYHLLTFFFQCLCRFGRKCFAYRMCKQKL